MFLRAPRFMFLRASLVGLALSCFALPESGPASTPVGGTALEADGKAEFEAALQQVQQSMQSRRFKEAKELLLSKLTEHKDKEYVRAHLDEVRADLKSCSSGDLVQTMRRRSLANGPRSRPSWVGSGSAPLSSAVNVVWAASSRASMRVELLWATTY